MTMAEQMPARKAVASSISTLEANTVSSHEAEKGRLTASRELRRPHRSTAELRRPPGHNLFSFSVMVVAADEASLLAGLNLS